ncbi:ABC transporter permease [Hippea sp. KM1]|uniref:ABC transporter permease n=1 Tax=Hippea sp. KM1 TaxID=944481 RepID=UPI00046D8804|nr:ABC transporter permease [Hippea sp. KM1]
MFYFEKRKQTPLKLKIAIPIVSLLIGFIVGSIAILITGTNPLMVYKELFLNAFGSWYAFSETLVAATPLILISAGLIIVFKMSVWNIGAFGQYIMGAIFSSYFAIFLDPSIPKPLMLSIMIVASLIGGALWALIPTLLKIFWEVNEVITTLLLNYVALYILKFLMYGPWKNPTSYGFPLSKTFPDSAQLPVLFSGYRLTIAFIFALLTVAIVWFLLKKTRFGYEVRVIGDNPTAARYAGINVNKDIIIAMAISGGLAGLAGMSQVSGIIHFLQVKINADYGYTSIIVAWISYLEPFLMLLASILFGGLSSGGYSIQISMRVSYGIVGLIESIVLFSLVGAQIFLNYRIRWKKHES